MMVRDKIMRAFWKRLRSAHRLAACGGQGLVEFVLYAGVLLFLLLGGLQMAVILNAALSVSQYSYAGARYAAVHGGSATASSYGATLKANVTPPATICTSGFGSATALPCPGGTAGLSTPSVTSSDSSGNITSGAQVTVSVTYDLRAGGWIFLPTSFFGTSIPTTVTNQSSMMAE